MGYLMTARRAGITGGICSIAAIIALVVTQHPEIRTPPEALQIIGDAEGCRRDPYMCPAGVLTDGVGNTHNVYAGKTLEQIAADWARNIAEAEQCINKGYGGAAMPDATFGAMVSMAFNHGCQRLSYNRNGSKTQIKRLAEVGDWRGMCNQIPRWDSGGKWPGIIKRRAKEQALCLSGL